MSEEVSLKLASQLALIEAEETGQNRSRLHPDSGSCLESDFTRGLACIVRQS